MPFAARAVIVDAPAAVPRLEEIELVDLVEDEVLVDIAATGVCHTDLSCADGVISTPYPVVLGHEATGVVREVGPQARTVAPGDRVVVSVAHHCGHCRYCETGYPPLCLRRWDGRARYSLHGQPSGSSIRVLFTNSID